MSRIPNARAELTAAIVREWHDELGWGVLDAAVFPGGCWAHFSAIRASGFLTLTKGQQVWVASEPAHQDGFDWRATQVQLSGNPDQWVDPPAFEPPSAAYQSTLTLSLDDGREFTGHGDEAMADFLGRITRDGPPRV